MTAVILRAEARRTVEIMSINSMRLSLMLGGQVDYKFDPRLNTYLDDVDILATDGLLDVDVDLSIGEAGDGASSELDTELAADLLSEDTVAVAGEDGQVALDGA